MIIPGKYWLRATPDRLWIMLADGETWARCLDRCVTLDRISPTEFAIRLAVPTGPLKGEIESSGRLTVIAPGSRAELVGTARGAAIGSLNWCLSATVEGESGGSRLTYSLGAKTSGGTNGAGLAAVEKTCRSSIERFLGALSHEFLSTDGHSEVEPSESSHALPTDHLDGGHLIAGQRPAFSSGMRLWPWIAVFILVGLRLLAFFES